MKKLFKHLISFLRECFAQNPAVLTDMVGNSIVLVDEDETICWPYGG